MKKETLTQIRRLSQSYAYTSIQLHEAVARKAGLTGTDHKYLGFLMKAEQMTAGELAALTGLTTGAVTGLIDRFEKKTLLNGYLRKTTGERSSSSPFLKTSWRSCSPCIKISGAGRRNSSPPSTSRK